MEQMNGANVWVTPGHLALIVGDTDLSGTETVKKDAKSANGARKSNDMSIGKKQLTWKKTIF